MKYMLMFIREEGGWEDTGSPQEQQGLYAKVGEWWARNSATGAIKSGEQLQPASAATTVLTRSGMVTDGPFLEAKESIGGYGIVEAQDLDTVIAMAKSWPANNKVEIRPVVERTDM